MSYVGLVSRLTFLLTNTILSPFPSLTHYIDSPALLAEPCVLIVRTRSVGSLDEVL
jgi:hypothetical protein